MPGPEPPPLPAPPPGPRLMERFHVVQGGGPGAGLGGGRGEGPDAALLAGRLLGVLGALDPGAAALAGACLPRGDSTVGAGLALFLAAMEEGWRGWLGPAVAARLAALDGGLLLDEADAAAAARFRVAGDRLWRVVRVPLRDGPGGGPGGGPGEEPGEAGITGGLLCATSADEGVEARFTVVLQARPPRLGPVQLTAATAGGRLDVTLRSAAGLPAAVLAGLHEACRTALADVGLQGDLTIGPLAGAWLVLDEDPGADVTL